MTVSLRITDQSTAAWNCGGIVFAEQFKFTENQTERANFPGCKRRFMTQFFRMSQVFAASFYPILQRDAFPLTVLLRDHKLRGIFQLMIQLNKAFTVTQLDWKQKYWFI